jgi:hypothetical protein
MPLDKTNAEQLDTLDTFFKNNQDLLNNQNPVQNQLYPFITNPNNQINEESLKGKFPFLPQELIKETLKCLEPIEGYQHKDKKNMPTQTTTPRLDIFTHHETYMITWNVASLNTTLPRITDLIQHTNQPTIIMIQETKFSEQKSTKYLNRLFPNYALTFNNTHAKTTCDRRPYIPYKLHRGGLLTMIHKNYNFPRNIKKIPSLLDISPYLQIILIKNKPLKSIILINLYMPSYPEDIQLIAIIRDTITETINKYPNHTMLLCGNFNRDVALIGRHLDGIHNPPNIKDIIWEKFTKRNGFKYIITNTAFSRQGGKNYTATSLIDGFYIKDTQNTSLKSITNINKMQNSDHFPIHSKIPPNFLIAKKPYQIPKTKKKLSNPILPIQIQAFHALFRERTTNIMQSITQTLNTQGKLSKLEWKIACQKLKKLIKHITKIVEETCTTKAYPTLTNQPEKQGGYLPRKQQKKWKYCINICHSVKSIIRILTQNAQWRNHPYILNILQTLQNKIPQPPSSNIEIPDWITKILDLAKISKKDAQ